MLSLGICLNVFVLCTEGKDCVVISEDGRGVGYKSVKDEVKHLNSLTASINFLAF